MATDAGLASRWPRWRGVQTHAQGSHELEGAQILDQVVLLCFAQVRRLTVSVAAAGFEAIGEGGSAAVVHERSARVETHE